MRYLTRQSSTQRPRRRPLAAATVTALGAALALGLSACGTAEEQPEDPGANESTTTTVTTEPTDEPANGTAGTGTGEETRPEQSSSVSSPVSDVEPATGPMGDPSTEDQWVQPDGASLMVTGVRTASHDGFDRVVFDLEGEGAPGWITMYTETPTQQGSGHPIDYTGNIALQVGVEGTPYPNDAGTEPPMLGTFPGAGNVTEVTYSSLFEGRTEFVIGLEEQVPYSVTPLENPTRLVIDFARG
ncbi:AMIN-like domain-containing (lipo)protein [Corynebacterium halotolerans]|uniref:AMIN-like domain-containing (lipo)protein n=1 Tax=Corynebacterium halotolerans TaxID=225326 RepID=UPI003CECBC45